MTVDTGVTENRGEPLLDLQRMASGIRWRRRLWSVMALVGLVAGIGVGAFLPFRASAAARIYVVHVDESSTDDSVMKTDLALLETTSVAAVAVERLRLTNTTPEKFVGTYTGTVVAGNILEVSARGSDGPDAIARTQAVADAFIAVHVSQAADSAKAEVDALGALRDTAQRDLDDVNDQIKTIGSADAAKQAALIDRRASLSSQVSSLDQRAQEASIGSPTVGAGTKIIDAAHVTSHSVLVSAGLYGGIGLLLGLGLGLVVAAIATVARDRPVLRRDIAAHLGASVIAQLPAPVRGPRKLVSRSPAEKERRLAAGTLARVVREDADAVSVLELGCPAVAAALARDMAEEIAGERPVVLVDDLPGGQLLALAEGLADGVTVIAGDDHPASKPDAGSRVLAVGSVGPGSPWTDLRRLGAETLVVVRAGSTETSWLHTVARQLADAGVVIIGVVVVHPDPRDRSDGTLWDALQTAVRGRLAGRPAPATADAVVRAAARAALQAAQAVVPAPPGGAARSVPSPFRPAPPPVARPAGPPMRVPLRRPDEAAPATEAIAMGPVDERTRAIPVAGPAGRAGADETVALPAQRQHRGGAPVNGTNGRPANGHATNGSATNGSPTNGSATNGSGTNGSGTNGSGTNGHTTNGSGTNGSGTNGSATNGSGTNGSATNGSGTNGHATNGSAAPASEPQNGAPAPSRGRGRPAPRPRPRLRHVPLDGHPTLKLTPVVRTTPADRSENP